MDILNPDVLIPALLTLASGLVPVGIGALLVIAIQIVRPLLLGARSRLEAVGATIVAAMETFKASKISPPELDSLVDLVINKWRLLSANSWKVTAEALDEIEAKARILARLTEQAKAKSNGTTIGS